MLTQLLQGHEADWQTLIDTLRPGMLAHIRRVASDEGQAEDLFNELLLDLVAGLRAIGSDRPPSPGTS